MRKVQVGWDGTPLLHEVDVRLVLGMRLVFFLPWLHVVYSLSYSSHFYRAERFGL